MTEKHKHHSVTSEVDQFLSSSNPFITLESTYGADRSPVSRSREATCITTHCAKIYMYGRFAIKVKRPVSYSYLSMTTLTDRHYFLERELQINQPHLPDIYLSLAAVVQTETGQLQLIVDTAEIDPAKLREWCLVMRRFDQSDILDNIAKSGALSTETIIALGSSIARYHEAVAPVQVDDGDTRIYEIIEELHHEFEKLGKQLPASLTSQFHKLGKQQFDLVAPTLRKRGEDGFIRECHGDLHLRNIVIHQGVPVPFDALEFDERLRTIDTLYDLAFVLMDLDHRFLLKQENRLLNEYLLRTPSDNIGAMNILPLFMYCRAGIKAMTTAQTAATNDNNGDAMLKEAKSYLQRGLVYLQPRRPIVVAIGGFSGSGKSTVARELPDYLCAAPGAILVRSDAERKAEFGVPETSNLGPDHYNRSNSRIVYDRVLSKVESAVASGYPVIVDATFLSGEQRHEVTSIANNAAVDFLGFWLVAPIEVLRERIIGRRNDASDASVEVLEKQWKKYNTPKDWIIIDSTDPVSQCVSNIYDHIKNHAGSHSKTK